jgi:Lantibiotic dehydratase, N terminus
MPPTAPIELERSLMPLFMLRVGGLPVEAAAPLRSPATVAWAGAVLELERQLDAAKGDLGDALGAAVGDADDAALRRRMLGLRRDVFNRRLPREPGLVEDLAPLLGPDLADRLTDWIGQRRRYDAEVARGAAILAQEMRSGRRHLRELATDDRLRFGVLLASPSLDRYLPNYVRTGDGPLSKRTRRIERSLLEYVFRSAYKTSPFSTLTPVALGRFDNAEQAVQVGALDPGLHSYTRLNLAVLARLTELVVTEPALLADLPVQITSGWRADDDTKRVRYVRRQRRIGDDDTAVTIDVLEEKLFYLSGSTLLDELLATVRPGEQYAFAELVDLLHGRDPDGRRSEDVEAYLRQLLRLGLLTVPALHVDIHHPDPVRGFRDGLSRLRKPWADTLVERLDLICGYVDEYRTAGLDRRRQLIEDVRSELGEAQHDLGRAEATIPRTLIYEDVTLGATPVVADRAIWQETLVPALSGLARILPVFDMTLPARLTTTGFFRARYGRGAEYPDVIKFAHEYQQDCYEQFMKYSMSRRPFDETNAYVPQQNWFRLPQIEALDRARLTLVERIRKAHDALPEGAPELVLTDELIDAVAAEIPDGIGDLDPRSFFMQVADDGGRPLGVLNRAYSGLGLLFSRFAHCFPEREGHDLTGAVTAALADVEPPGTVFAELTGGYETTNLNLHPPVTRFEIVCPGDVSSRPADRQIPIDDLYIVDDLEADEAQLRSRRLGVRVIPVYLGFLMPMALPEVQRVLLTFSYASMAALDLWAGQDPPPSDGVVAARPRIRYRDLVLQRRTWTVEAKDLPNSTSADGEAEWFLDWARWVHDHGLPRRVFAATEPQLRSAPGTEGAAEPEERGTPLSKPQYVDFDSAFSLSLLDAVIRTGNQRLVLTEMLPDLDQLWLRDGAGGRVTELTVELDGVRRRIR